MTSKEAEVELNNLLSNIIKELPSDKLLDAFGDCWEKYIRSTDLVRGLHCKKDFMMGIVMGCKVMKPLLKDRYKD